MTTLNVTKRTIVCSRKGSEMVENENEKNVKKVSNNFISSCCFSVFLEIRFFRFELRLTRSSTDSIPLVSDPSLTKKNSEKNFERRKPVAKQVF